MDLNVLLSNFDNDPVFYVFAYIQSIVPLSPRAVSCFLLLIFLSFALFFLDELLHGEKELKFDIIAFLVIFGCIVFSGFAFFTDYNNLCKNIDNYYIISQKVNKFPFDELKNGDIKLNDGKTINIQRLETYPDDLLVSYKDINIEIENDNGQSKAVALFDKNMKEINVP